jgi:hypothetical protein
MFIIITIVIVGRELGREELGQGEERGWDRDFRTPRFPCSTCFFVAPLCSVALPRVSHQVGQRDTKPEMTRGSEASASSQGTTLDMGLPDVPDEPPLVVVEDGVQIEVGAFGVDAELNDETEDDMPKLAAVESDAEGEVCV